MTLKVDIFSKPSGIVPYWPCLSDQNGAAFYPFQALDHIETWLATIGAARRVRPVILRVTNNGEPVLLAALGVERRRGVRVLSFLDGGVWDYNAPVLLASIDSARLRGEIMRALPRVDAVVFEKMPARIGAFDNALSGLGGATQGQLAYSLPLKGGWSEYEKSTLHRAKDSRRKRRRLSEAGSVRFLVGGVNADPDRLLQSMIRLKTARYLARD